MEILLKVMTYLGLVGLGFLIKDFFPTYMKKKAENLATKEDIQEITAKIETVKHEYATQLETVRASLTSQVHIHQVRYEKEFDILTELTKCLVNLREVTKQLRPIVDSYNRDEPEEKRKQERLNRYNEAVIALSQSAEWKRPFYPESIFEILQKLKKITWEEALQYAHIKMSDVDFDSYWGKATENSEKITNLAEEAISAIRSRVKEWEKLGGDTRL